MRKSSADGFTSRRDPVDGAAEQQFGLEWSLLAYSSSITLLMTLAPFRFQWPVSINYIWTGGWFDTISNVLLFLPLGFLYRLTRKGRVGASSFHVFCLGFCVSAGLETAQLFLPGRYPSPMDVLTNALGAWLGAWLCGRAQQLLNRQWMGRLGLELPLMNIVYLLVPLIWLDGLAAGGDQSRSRLVWILGLCGSVVIAGVYRYGMKQPTALKVSALVCIAAGWFLASSIPAFLNSASIPLYGSVLVACSVYLLTILPVFGHTIQRRFETPVLKRVWPPYAVYLLLLFLWPIPSEYVGWHGEWVFVDLADVPGIIPVLRLIEHFAAFTLLGYMVAESHGRREISPAMSIVWTCFWCGLAVALLEVCRGFHPSHTASVAAGLLTFVGSVYGAFIYWRQLSSIQARLLRVLN